MREWCCNDHDPLKDKTNELQPAESISRYKEVR